MENLHKEQNVTIVNNYYGGNRSKSLALVFWLLFGATGLPEFYLGKTGRGVAMLMMFLFNIVTMGFGLFLTAIPIFILWLITLGNICELE